MLQDIKAKSGKLLVILTAVQWNILNGGVIVFLISSARVYVYLFTCSVNKASVCCSPPPILVKNPFEASEQLLNRPCWKREDYSLNRKVQRYIETKSESAFHE